MADPVEDVEKASPFAHGSVKWDGCSHWGIDEAERVMIHGCSRKDLENIGLILAACWDMAKEYCEKWSAEEAAARV